MNKYFTTLAVGILLFVGSTSAQAYSCSNLGSQSEMKDVVSCLKKLNRQIEDLENENHDLKRQLRSLDTDKSRQSRDVDDAIKRLERELDAQAEKSFKLQCRRAYSGCSFGKVLLSQPGSEEGVCCSVVPGR